MDNVKLLDGGRKKWEAEKRPLDTRTTDVAPSKFTAADTRTGLRARLVDVVAVAKGERKAKILDIRSPDEFSGKIIAPAGFQELAIRAGHIPTSVNVPWARAVNQDGTFKPVAELKKLYADAGVDGSQPRRRSSNRESIQWSAHRGRVRGRNLVPAQPGPAKFRQRPVAGRIGGRALVERQVSSRRCALFRRSRLRAVGPLNGTQG